MIDLADKAPEKLPRLSRRDWEILGETMLPLEMGGRRQMGKKVAERLMAHGFIEPCEERLGGNGKSVIDRIPIIVKGYRMTLAGNISYCFWAGDTELEVSDV